MDLVVDAIVPVISTGQQHGAGGAANSARSIAAIEEHPSLDQPVQIRSSAEGPVADAGPDLLIRHDVEDIRLWPWRLSRTGEDARSDGLSEKVTAIHCCPWGFRRTAVIRTGLLAATAVCRNINAIDSTGRVARHADHHEFERFASCVLEGVHFIQAKWNCVA